MIGKTISHYRILEKLGEGGMGVVYKAEDTKLKRTVALKFISPQVLGGAEEKSRFVHEAQAAASLNHSNICTVYEIDESEEQSFIAMEYIQGESLKDRIDSGPLKLDDAVNLTIQIAGGIQEAHEKGIVHRDIKPANVMITGKGQAKIMDFGLAKLAGHTKLTKTGTAIGTVAYMSPEQARGDEVDRRSDIWSLGALLYEMITGQSPFRGDYGPAVVYSIMNQDPEPVTALRTGVPLELERIVNKAIAKDPRERYQHADEMVVDLAAVARKLGGGTGEDTGPRGIPPAARPRRFSTVAVASAAALVVAIVLLVLGPLRKSNQVVSSPRPVVVMPFENQTGDPGLDYLKAAIPNLLITNLEQSSYLSVLTWDRMRDVLKAMGKNDMEIVDIDRETGFELCRMEGVKGIVVGTFTQAGEVFATDIKVMDVSAKSLLKTASSRGRGVESILEAQIDELSKAISRVVVSAPEGARTEMFRIADVTTNSMEAYRHYLQGVKYYHQFMQDLAVQELRMAVDLDREFAMAYYYLAKVYSQLQNATASRAAIADAVKYSGRATERETFYIKDLHATLVEGDLEKALHLNEKLVEKYPKEKDALLSLGLKYRSLGRTSDEIDAYRRALALDPEYVPALNSLGYSYVRVGDYEGAEDIFRKNLRLSPEDPNAFDSIAELYFIMGRMEEAVYYYKQAYELSIERFGSEWETSAFQIGYILALQGRYEEALQQYDIYPASGSMPEWKMILDWNKARLKMTMGQFRDAMELLLDGIAAADSAGAMSRSAQAHELLSFVYAENQDVERTENELKECLNIRMSVEPEDGIRWNLSYNCVKGFFNVKTGDLQGARENLAYVKEMLPRLNHRTGNMYSYWSTLLDGELKLAEGRISEAIEILENVTPPDASWAGWQGYHLYRLPVPRDGLARAYRASDKTDEAISEYHRLLTLDQESGSRFLPDSRYYFQLAKCYEDRGQTESAIGEYERFLQVWSKADDGLPEIESAETRLAVLRESSRN